MKTLLLGIGNTILGDDGAGVRCVNAVSRLVPPHPDLVIKDTAAAGLNLLDTILGYDRLIVVDAVLAGEENIGKVFRLSLANLQNHTGAVSLHSCGLTAVLALGRQLYDMQVPHEVTIIGIGIRAVDTVTESLTPPVVAALPEAIKLVLNALPAVNPVS